MPYRPTQTKLRLVRPDAVDEGKAQPDSGNHTDKTADRSGVSQLGDAELVALTLGGSRRAYELLYRRHVRATFLLATRILGSTGDAEDAVHDAFIRAYERLGELATPASFRSWLNSILVHIVQSKMRRARLLRTLGLANHLGVVQLDALASPDASPAARAQIAQIYALLQTMRVDDRIAWTLRYVEGHDLETAAQLAGCSLSSIKRRIQRAQQFLTQHFVDPDDEASEEESS